MNAQTADGPNESFEHEENRKPITDLHAATERLGRATFTVHGMTTAVRDLLHDVKGMLAGLKSERWNPDASRPSDPDMDRIVRLTAREAARATVEIGRYHEGPEDDKPEPSWQSWILTIVGVLIAGGIGATAYQLSEVKEKVAGIAAKQDTSIEATNQRLEADERRIETLERKVFQ